MRGRLATWSLFVGGASSAALAWLACSSTYTTPDTTEDGGPGIVTSQDAAPVLNPNYSLTITAQSIIVDPGGAVVPISVTIDRKNGFDEGVSVTIANAPAGVSAMATIPSTDSAATVNVTAAMTATVGQSALASIVATSTRTGVVATQPLFVRVGHVLLVATSTQTWTVPPDVTYATFSVWGAGGGGGGSASQYPEPGGAGGAGGFAQASFKVTPGSMLQVEVGQGGGLGTDGPNRARGGGGGGWSAVSAADASLLIAAGGGGGGGGAFGASSSNYAAGLAGGDGAGANGTAGTGNILGNGGAGGTTSCDGGAHTGGGGVSNGGTPNGGGTMIECGAGGGGYCGGGWANNNTSVGGGGGSGFVSMSAGAAPAAVRDTGMGANAPQTMNAAYATGVAVGGTGAVVGLNAKAAANGGPGRVVVTIATMQ